MIICLTLIVRDRINAHIELITLIAETLAPLTDNNVTSVSQFKM